MHRTSRTQLRDPSWDTQHSVTMDDSDPSTQRTWGGGSQLCQAQPRQLSESLPQKPDVAQCAGPEQRTRRELRWLISTVSLTGRSDMEGIRKAQSWECL